METKHRLTQTHRSSLQKKLRPVPSPRVSTRRQTAFAYVKKTYTAVGKIRLLPSGILLELANQMQRRTEDTSPTFSKGSILMAPSRSLTTIITVGWQTK